jgi:cytochrome o ubiquinol oxidase subunit IV
MATPISVKDLHGEESHTSHDAGAHHGSVTSYAIGFILSVILTVAAFWMVMHGGFSRGTIVSTIVALAIIQVFVHLGFFLHLNFAPDQRWTLVSFGFAVMVVAIILIGSLWIMRNIADNMTDMTKMTPAQAINSPG